jgi:hypothetical protein
MKIAFMKKFEQSEFTECLLSFGEEYFDFPFAIQNMKIKVNITLIVSFVLHVYETCLSHWKRYLGWGFSTIGCWGKYFGLKKRRGNVGVENITEGGGFMICTSHLIFFRAVKSKWLWCARHVAYMGGGRGEERSLIGYLWGSLIIIQAVVWPHSQTNLCLCESASVWKMETGMAHKSRFFFSGRCFAIRIFKKIIWNWKFGSKKEMCAENA